MAMALTQDDWDALEAVYDRFEARVYRSWEAAERRMRSARHAQILEAMRLEDPWVGPGAKRDLTYYDGHVETHGQDS